MSGLTNQLRAKHDLVGDRIHGPAKLAGMSLAKDRDNIAGLILLVEESRQREREALSRVAALERAIKEQAVQMQDLARDARGYEHGHRAGAEQMLHAILMVLGAEREDAEFEAGAPQGTDQRAWYERRALYLRESIEKVLALGTPDPWVLDMLYRECRALERRVGDLEGELEGELDMMAGQAVMTGGRESG